MKPAHNFHSYDIDEEGNVYASTRSSFRIKGSKLSTHTNDKGTVVVSLTKDSYDPDYTPDNKQNNRVRRSLPALVYATYHGPIPSTHYVTHIDGNKQNNAPHNLTLKERPVSFGTTKLTEDNVRSIRQQWAQRPPRGGRACIRRLAKQHNVGYGTIDAVVYGRSHTHVTQDTHA